MADPRRSCGRGRDKKPRQRRPSLTARAEQLASCGAADTHVVGTEHAVDLAGVQRVARCTRSEQRRRLPVVSADGGHGDGVRDEVGWEEEKKKCLGWNFVPSDAAPQHSQSGDKIGSDLAGSGRSSEIAAGVAPSPLSSTTPPRSRISQLSSMSGPGVHKNAREGRHPTAHPFPSSHHLRPLPAA